MIKDIYRLLIYLNYPGFNKHERRSLFLHSFIDVSFALALAIFYMLFLGAKTTIIREILAGLMAILVILAIVHGIYAYVTGQTYWSARIKGAARSRTEAEESKAELLAYAEKMKKRTHGQN